MPDGAAAWWRRGAAALDAAVGERRPMVRLVVHSGMLQVNVRAPWAGVRRVVARGAARVEPRVLVVVHELADATEPGGRAHLRAVAQLGAAGLVRGLSARLVQVGVIVTVQLILYDTLKHAFGVP